jgi:diguanylate cyclase (GGDEF)-like protein/putative nucleotidyltransferase with HDIG domain
MHNFENNRKKQIYEVLSIVKLLSLFFCGIIFFSQYHSLIQNNNNMIFSELNIGTTLSFCIVLFLIYQIWVITSKKLTDSQNFKLTNALELIFFISLFSGLIILSGKHTSQYKFLFLFVIITSTIQFGKKLGLSIASISSTIILVIDLMGMPLNEVNTFFEIDLVLVGIFLLTAWLLGDYVKVEAHYRKQILNLANIDELTGLYNHRYFQESLDKYIMEAKNSNQPVSLLFIDIDYFKNYNDLFGHIAGDKVLNEISNILKSLVKGIGIAARYGGEEFAIILPATSESEAIGVGEKIRNVIESKYFEGQENLPSCNLTISVGVSTFPHKAKSKKELLNSADDALYRAKFFNKNKVESYYSVLEELKQDIKEEHIDLISSIKTFISVINAKDRYTFGHTERVVIYCKLMADKLNLSEEDKRILKYGAYLHDIGKIQISKEILNKKMPLTNKEWEAIKHHPQNGVTIIKPVTSLEKVIPLILHHHERYDGKGYPDNLKGGNIPYLARILTLADSFDAMTSNRPYQPVKSYEEAIEELKMCSGSQFDPLLVEAFIEVINKNKDYLNSFRFKGSPT